MTALNWHYRVSFRYGFCLLIDYQFQNFLFLEREGERIKKHVEVNQPSWFHAIYTKKKEENKDDYIPVLYIL